MVRVLFPKEWKVALGPDIHRLRADIRSAADHRRGRRRCSTRKYGSRVLGPYHRR